MNQPTYPPSLERVKQRAVKVQEICQQADANILILDEIIAQLEEQIHHSSLSRYRLNKAKKLLKL
jgi:thiamine monophosphate synthase